MEAENFLLQFSRDDIELMAHDLVMVIAREIVTEFLTHESILKDDDKSKNDIKAEIRESFEVMTKLWAKLRLNQCKLLARKIYPKYEPLFDLLDKSVDLDAAVSDVCENIDLVS